MIKGLHFLIVLGLLSCCSKSDNESNKIFWGTLKNQIEVVPKYFSTYGKSFFIIKRVSVEDKSITILLFE